MITQPTYELGADWVLLVDAVDYILQTLSEEPAEIFLHTTNASAPAADAEGHAIFQGEAINVAGIVWGRGFKVEGSDKVQRTRVLVTK